MGRLITIHQLLASMYSQGVGSTTCSESDFICNEDSNAHRRRRTRSRRHECLYETRISEVTQADRVPTACGHAPRRGRQLMNADESAYEKGYAMNES